MADASGIKRMKPEELNPMETSSFGTGQLIKHAIDNGCSEILLGVGGSATVDGGSGMLEALGFQFFNSKSKILSGNGENLVDISKIEKPENEGRPDKTAQRDDRRRAQKRRDPINRNSTNSGIVAEEIRTSLSQRIGADFKPVVVVVPDHQLVQRLYHRGQTALLSGTAQNAASG